MGSSTATLSSLLAAGEPADPALVDAESGDVVTYEGLQEVVAALAGRLCALGVGRGSRVAIAVPDGQQFVRLLLATVSIGATAAPLNPAYKRDEYELYLDDLSPELLLVPAGDLRAAREAAGEGVRVADVAGESEVALLADGQELSGARPVETPAADDIALLLHTSGTTSRPKQVPLLQRNLVSSAQAIASFYGLSAGDVSYCAMPLFHVHGLVASVFAALAAGGTVVVPRRFTPRAFWPQLRTHGVTWFSAAPTLHAMLLERVDDKGAPAALRFVRSCSSALPAWLMQHAEETYGAPMIEAYGMTEASHQVASNPLPPGERKPGSVGIPTGTRVKIVDADGHTLPAGALGEVAIHGSGVTAGYLSNPQANADSFFDGWFRTGDSGVLDQEGYLRLEARLKEIISRGGENISPYEIEKVLLAHPVVSDAICFGIDDEKYGERVGAAVAVKTPVAERELIARCRERLAAFKVPEVVHVLDAIPRTPTGKVQRKRVGAWLARNEGEPAV